MKKFISFSFRQLRLIKFIGFYQYTKYIFNFSGSLIEVLINNINIYVRRGTPDLNVAISCLHGEFEALRYLQDREFDGIIIDAGGYIGTAAIALSQLFPKATVLTIEPSIENFKVLKRNIKNYKNIKPIFGALVSRDKGNISLVNRGSGPWGYTTVQNPLDKEEATLMHEVPSLSLSSLTSDADSIGILKLDIEGGEHDILLNDLETLKRIPVVIAELHDRIVNGCSKEFFNFSKNRIVVKDSGEKFLSIKNNLKLD